MGDATWRPPPASATSAATGGDRGTAVDRCHLSAAPAVSAEHPTRAARNIPARCASQISFCCNPGYWASVCRRDRCVRSSDGGDRRKVLGSFASAALDARSVRPLKIPHTSAPVHDGQSWPLRLGVASDKVVAQTLHVSGAREHLRATCRR
jgi:hypothetical protein